MDRKYREKTTNISISIVSTQILLLTMSVQYSSKPFFNPTPIPKKLILKLKFRQKKYSTIYRRVYKKK